ncbi:MAG: formate dehydrogenase accessory sulfurtransferase FdhD [Marinobacter sp.]|uniref:formate dehydrogenase accessory sulfurtransferase FdhD n=1 Tax=Marinobacter sp. TaxID=50741 RepID=UPI0034A00764
MAAKTDNPALVRTAVDVRGLGQPGGSVHGMTDDVVAQETPVAMVYNGISHAVMLASPADLEDFALGFSLTEGIIESPGELYDLEVEQAPEGLSVSMRISNERFAVLKAQRRNMTGRTGCGLCGTESLEQAIRPIKLLRAGVVVSDAAIQRAVQSLRNHQPLQAETGATHGAAWCNLAGDILAVREDVGRHNALDKLIGFQLRTGSDLQQGFALISSRASFEMVQKSAAVGIGCLVAVSAPTALAVAQARKAGLMLVGFARPNRHVIYHPGEASGSS